MNAVNSSFLLHPAYECRLTTGQSVDVLPRCGQRTLDPGRTAVLRAKHLTLASGTEYSLRIAWTRRHGHHCAAHGHAVVKTFPGLSEILTTIDRTIPSHGSI